MKELLLLRHAKSSWAKAGQDDFERPLNGRGERSARAMGRWLAQQNLQPQLILCSPAERTRRTLDLVQEALAARVPVHLEPELYLADSPTLLARVRQIADDVPSVLVIAHNPGLQEFVAALMEAPGASSPDQRAQVRRKFPTAAFARFRLKVERWRELMADAAAGTVKLLTLMTPGEIAGD